jgi:ABC-2 type transport system permease protein
MAGDEALSRADASARSARKALARGDRPSARRAAFLALKSDPTCELAWLVLAALADPPARRNYLEHILAINSNRETAIKARKVETGERRMLDRAYSVSRRKRWPDDVSAIEDTKPHKTERIPASIRPEGTRKDAESAAAPSTTSFVRAKQNMVQNLRVVATACEMALKHAATDSFIIFAVFVQPLIIALLGLYMLRERGGDYAIFVVVGSGLTGLWSSLLFVSGGALNQERWSGTLESLVGMPTSLEVVVFGKNLAYVTQSLGSMVLAYALASLLFGTPLRVAQPLLFLASIVLTTISFVCLGLLLAPMFVANPDIRNFVNALEYPMYILAGFLFPIALLPGWTTPLSYVLAPYWAAEALHAASTGTASLNNIALDWGMLLVLGAAYVLIGRWLFRVFLRKARQDATLDFF